MKNRKWMGCLPLALLALFVSLSPAYGDLYWEYEEVSGGMPEGFPEDLPKQVRDQMLAQFKPKTETTKHYLTSYASRTETGEMIIIMNFRNMIVYQINPSDKTYRKMNMMSEMGRMAEGMAEGRQVRASNETKKIAGYTCRKYIVTMMGFENEHWLSKDVKGYAEYKAMTEKMYESNPRLKQMQMGDTSEMQGFPVKTVSNVMGITTTTTLKKIEKKTLSKDLFEVPRGYKLIELEIPPR